MAMEFGEALEKIHQLSEEKTRVVKELDVAKEELSQLRIEVLAVRKEALDASIQATEATKKM